MLKEKDMLNRLFAKTDIYELGELVRYNTRTKIKKQCVASHTAYVSQTILEICTILNIDDETTFKALKYGIIHDIPESKTCDIPYNVKKDIPFLNSVMKEAELKVMEEYYPHLKEEFIKFTKAEEEEKIEGIIVKLADVVDVLRYSRREILLGNKTDEMNNIYKDALYRTSIYTDKLLNKIQKVKNF